AQLFCVNSDAKSERLCPAKNPKRLIRTEHARLAENIAIAGEIIGHDRRQHLIQYQIQVIFPRCAGDGSSVLVGYFMSAKKGWNQVERRLLIEPPDHSKNFEFVLDSQPVAALGFDCGSAVIEKPPNPRLRGLEQLFFRCCASLSNGRANSAAALRN